MIEPSGARRPPVSSGLAVRVAVLGGVALVCFGIVFFRLWFLQVLSGQEYLAEANSNRVRNLTIPAPRGYVVDRNGEVLVDNRVAKAVELEPQALPDSERAAAAAYGKALAAVPRARQASVRVAPLDRAQRPLRRRYARLGRVLGLSSARIHERVVESLYVTPFSNVSLKFDVKPEVSAYLKERRRDFAGVQVRDVFLRRYPHGELAAQLFGSVGQISGQQLREPAFRGVRQGTVIGQSGLERTYDAFLRGVDGATRVQVDAMGQPKGQGLRERPPVQGRQLQTSLDLGLQRAGERALRTAFRLPRSQGGLPMRAGAFVALDPRQGAVLAMGSAPTFDPNVFAKAVSSRVYERLNSEQAGSPLVNRAIGSVYPTGSTFKPITGTAALESGAVGPFDPIFDGGTFTLPGGQTRRNAGGAAYGSVSIRPALAVSSDVFFYTLGARMNSTRPAGGPLQGWAHRYGLGQGTGIDLPGESPGNVPSPAWRAKVNRLEARCRARTHHPCGYAADPGRQWSIGDNVSLAVGQGDVQATPLQMAVAYSALVNGGKVPTPHLGLEVQSPGGERLRSVERPAARHFRLGAATRDVLMGGLRDAASAPRGTSTEVFKGFERPVFGKTGTAQTAKGDQSWYVCYVPDPRRPIVVAVTIESGGFGAETAAPAARLILAQWFGLRKSVKRGTSRTF